MENLKFDENVTEFTTAFVNAAKLFEPDVNFNTIFVERRIADKGNITMNYTISGRHRADETIVMITTDVELDSAKGKEIKISYIDAESGNCIWTRNIPYFAINWNYLKYCKC